MEITGQFMDIDKTQRDIDTSSMKATRSAQVMEGEQSMKIGKEFEQGMARFGGGAFDTGASKAMASDIVSDMTSRIANITNQYEIQRNSMKLSAEQYFTNLASQGVIDPATGSFLKSTYNMQVELNDQQFRNQMTLLQKQGQMQESASMWGGLGTLAGLWLKTQTGGIL